MVRPYLKSVWYFWGQIGLRLRELYMYCICTASLKLRVEEIWWSTENFTPPSRSEFAILLSNLCWMEYQFILHPAKMRSVLQQISSIFTNLFNNFFLLLTECSIWSFGDTSDVVGDDHFTEYSMTSEHHGDITVQTEAEWQRNQIRPKLKGEFSIRIWAK